MLGGNVADELGDKNGFAHARAAEKTDFTALGVGADEVDDLQTRLENLRGRDLLLESGSRPVDGELFVGLDFASAVDCLAQEVENPAQSLLAHGNPNGAAGVNGFHAPDKAVGGLHGHAANHVVAYHLGDLNGESVALNIGNLHGVQNLRQFVLVESDVHDGTDNSYNFAFVHNRTFFIRERRRR